jgi:phosphoesterase RecJ-like protein
VDPDGDAIGCLTGLGRALHQLGKQPILVCSDPVPLELSFVPGVDLVVREISGPYDLAILLDCSEPRRCVPLDQGTSAADVPLINIDHHLTNRGFGTVDLVGARVSSTAEIVLQLLEFMSVPVDAETATCLLTGIVTDTRGFRTSNVTPDTMEAALRLMKAGASLGAIAGQTLDRRTVPAMRLWGAALASVRVEAKVIWTAITLEMAQTAGFAQGGDARLASFLISADSVDGAAVFVEREPQLVEVGLRAAPGFDISKVAAQFGGGGHALAAGCSVEGALEDVQRQVLAALRADLRRQRETRARRNSQPQ